VVAGIAIAVSGAASHSQLPKAAQTQAAQQQALDQSPHADYQQVLADQQAAVS